jgi:predicted aspartyl protease
MGLIVKNLEVFGDKGKLKAQILFDTGARRSVIRKDIAEKIATIIKFPFTFKFFLADGKTNIETDLVADIMINIDNRIIFDQFPVLDKLSKDIIIGSNTLQSWEIKLDPKNESITVGVDPKAIDLL